MKENLLPKILVDTNIIISAAINPVGRPAYLLDFLLAFDELIICEYTVYELHKFLQKKSSKYPKLKALISEIENRAVIIKIPDEPIKSENLIRDVNDRPILRAAVANNIDIIISGDKDFLESGINTPKILTAHDFLMELNNSKKIDPD